MSLLPAALQIAGTPARGKITAPPRFASAREAIMRKPRAACKPPSEQDWPDRSFGKGASSPDFHAFDERLSRLLILLRQLVRSLPGLVGVPEVKLNEIVYSAVYLCGFVSPSEAEYAIENVLEALEAENLSGSQCSDWSGQHPPGITFHSDS
jgi:hypothetical protein